MSTQDPDLLFLLHDIAGKLRLEFDRRARAHGMTRAQWMILLWIDRRPGLSQRELAEILDVEPITVARLLDRLEVRAMLERRPDPADKRMWRLHLCPKAAEVLADVAAARAEISSMLTDGMDAAQRAIVLEALLTMKTALACEARPDARKIA